MKTKYHVIIITICLIAFFSGCSKSIKKQYYSTGELKSKYELKNRKKHGMYFSYFKDGSIKKKIQYENGIKNGIYKEFYSNNTLKIKGFYRNEKMDSIFSYYYKNGKLKQSNEFHDGMLHGLSKYFYPSGELKMEAISKFDSTIYYRMFNKNGSIEDEYRTIKVFTNKEEIKLGDSIKIYIKVYGPVYENEFIRILANESKTSNTNDDVYTNLTGKGKIQSIEYFFTPEDTGNYIIKGFAEIFYPPNKGIRHPFSKTFTVIKEGDRAEV